ncbi:hypothetical protein KPH14_010524 [Odynerus spinipes]|uniref:vitamin-K-epoxide reductase (warfarin-sensitive) n=1 Tax=Odynerus spinipes TaxID=1348599 RepID=A0AAD9RUK3_9HYME|nr:hypothetical protein KPH14_010524 [Odynerus spinipes]
MPTTVPYSIRKITTGLILTCVVGTLLTYYAYIVETTKENEESYEAMCDINAYMSCTKVLTSGYGKGFGILPENSPLYFPNSLYGLGFYLLVAGLSILNTNAATFTIVLLSILSNICSVYLAYILYILRNICVVCVSTYIVNAVILILGIKKLQLLFEIERSKAKPE